MDYVTPMHIALATPLAIAAIYECLKVKQKLDEEPRRVKLSLEDHLEIRKKAYAIILPFPENNHHEQEITQQSKKTMTATYLNNLLDLKKFLNKFTDEELQSQDCFVLNYREEDRDYPGTYHLESKDIQYIAINQWTIEFYEDKEALNLK